MSSYKAKNKRMPQLNESWTKPALYAGMGVETDLNDIFLIGFEGRYNIWWTDKDKMETTNDTLDDVSVLLKIGIKF
jgi:opacity protein-like surface antigen